MIPSINSKGVFELVEPYNTLIDSRAIYTVVGVDLIPLLSDMGMDIYRVVYEPLGMSRDDMLEDEYRKIPIVTLSTETGENVSVPSDAILDHPRLDGHIYSEKMMIVPLGTLPNELDVGVLCEDVRVFVHDRIGVTTKVNIIPTSNSIMLTNEEHDVYNGERIANIRNDKSFRIMFMERDETIEQLKKRVNILEKHITDHL